MPWTWPRELAAWPWGKAASATRSKDAKASGPTTRQAVASAPATKEERKEQERILLKRLERLVDEVKTLDTSTVHESVRPIFELFKLWTRRWTPPMYNGRPYYNGWTEICDKVWSELVQAVDPKAHEPAGIEIEMNETMALFATLWDERRERKRRKEDQRMVDLVKRIQEEILQQLQQAHH